MRFNRKKMKKLLVLSLTIAITLLVHKSWAQESETDFREKLQVGMKIGANYSNVYDSKGEQFNADPRFGLAAGGFIAIPIGKYLGIQPELLFSQKGFQATGKVSNQDYEMTRTTSYIDIPLMFALKPIEFLTLVAGPQYSYLIKQKDVFTNSVSSFAVEQEFKNDNIRKNIFCFTGGADFIFKHYVASARVGWDISNNNGDGTSTTPRYKNIWYQFTVGYSFSN